MYRTRGLEIFLTLFSCYFCFESGAAQPYLDDGMLGREVGPLPEVEPAVGGSSRASTPDMLMRLRASARHLLRQQLQRHKNVPTRAQLAPGHPGVSLDDGDIDRMLRRKPKRGTPGMTMNTAEILFHALKKPRSRQRITLRNTRMTLKGLANLFKTGRRR